VSNTKDTQSTFDVHAVAQSNAVLDEKGFIFDVNILDPAVVVFIPAVVATPKST
jgi:hypothetical protein